MTQYNHGAGLQEAAPFSFPRPQGLLDRVRRHGAAEQRRAVVAAAPRSRVAWLGLVVAAPPRGPVARRGAGRLVAAPPLRSVARRGGVVVDARRFGGAGWRKKEKNTLFFPHCPTPRTDSIGTL